MRDQLQQAIELARKTGDRLIVFDSVSATAPYVVMGLNQYEKLVLGTNEVRDLTEDELLDKINRDIAIWKNEQIDRSETVKNRPESIFSQKLPDRFFTGVDEIIGERDRFGLERRFSAPEPLKRPARRQWTIPAERKEAAEEVIEEDRVYLEDL